MCFPSLGRKKDTSAVVSPQANLVKECIPEQAWGYNHVSSILGDVKIFFFFLLLTVSLFSTTLKDKAKTLHEHLEAV